MIRALGGSPVVLPGSQIYSALEKGVVDGACWPAAGMLSMKHYEVAKYRVRPTFGSSNLPVLVNLDAWNKLNDKEKGVLLAAGRETELEMPWVGRQILAEETDKLDGFGVKTLHLPPEKADLVKKAWSQSLWKVARECCGRRRGRSLQARQGRGHDRLAPSAGRSMTGCRGQADG